MLKIKDNVDLKELEKFDGLTKTHFIYFACGVRVNKETRIIEIGNFKHSPYFNLGKTRYMVSNAIYDLIQAGLVEKIGN